MKINIGRFFKNAAILTFTSLILRFAGMLFRVWMANSIGSEGMGLYQQILSFYMLAATFAGPGITTAVTRLISAALSRAKSKAVKKILQTALLLSVAVAALSAVAVVAFARPIALYWIKDIRAQLSIKLLSISLPFMAVTSCLRGYFVAYRKVITPSLAQLTEQAVRMGFIVFAMARIGTKDVALACAVVLLGDSIAEASSCLYTVIGYFIHRRGQGRPLGQQRDERGVLSQLLRIAAPITAGRYLTTGLRTLESMLVPIGLTAFCADKALALAQYGNLKGMALPLLFFPASFLTALATLTVPELSGAAAKGDTTLIRSSVSRLIGVTSTVSVIIMGIFALFGDDISRLLYSEQEVGFYLRVLAPLVPMMYLESIATGCLHGLDRQNDIFKYNVIDGVVRILLVWLMLESTGIRGFVLIMAASNLLTSILCLNKLVEVTGIKTDLADWALKPLITAVPSLAVGYGVGMLFSSAPLVVKTVAECAAAAVIFLIFQKNNLKSIIKKRAS